jgi:MFS family permease
MNTPRKPDSAYAWYVVFILLLAYALSYVDRQILSLMVGPIRKDLNLTDTQLSLLHGFAFALFYTFLGVPLGWWADRRNRKNLMGVGLGIWGIATAACGLANTFWQLFGTRVFVGVGEAALSPAAYSMISDYFSREKRGRALSVYATGVAFGAGLAAVLGGIAIGFAGSVAAWLGQFGLHFRDWQIVFIMVGVPAALLLPFVFGLIEPARQEVGKLSGNAWQDFKVGLGSIAARRNIYLPAICALALTAIVNYGSLAWVPSYFIRVFHWTAPQIGLAFGLTVMGFGASGMLMAGVIADWLIARGRGDGHIIVMVTGAICAIAPAAAFSFLKTDMHALIAVGAMMFFLMFPIGLGPALLQSVTPNELRGQVSALYLFVVNLIALGFGPTIVAATGDYIFHDELMIGRALAVVSWVVLPIAIVLLLIARPHARDHIP